MKSRPRAIILNTVVLAAAITLYMALFARPSHYVHFRIVIPKGFSGTLLLHESPNIPLDYSRVYVLKANKGVLDVPKGFLADGPQQPVFYDIVDVEDDSGTSLSRGQDPPIGEVGVRGMFGYNGDYYFTVKNKP